MRGLDRIDTVPVPKQEPRPLRPSPNRSSVPRSCPAAGRLAPPLQYLAPRGCAECGATKPGPNADRPPEAITIARGNMAFANPCDATYKGAFGGPNQTQD